MTSRVIERRELSKSPQEIAVGEISEKDGGECRFACYGWKRVT